MSIIEVADTLKIPGVDKEYVYDRRILTGYRVGISDYGHMEYSLEFTSVGGGTVQSMVGVLDSVFTLRCLLEVTGIQIGRGGGGHGVYYVLVDPGELGYGFIRGIYNPLTDRAFIPEFVSERGDLLAVRGSDGEVKRWVNGGFVFFEVREHKLRDRMGIDHRVPYTFDAVEGQSQFLEGLGFECTW